MISYQQSTVWQKTLAKQSGSDTHEIQREFLRVEFINFRQKAIFLANEIARILPDYTVHDITHIDALWDTAELLIPDGYDINPAEAFVLGGAFLLHDLGMALAAYPGGMDEIKKQQIWIDTAVALQKEKNKDEYINVNNLSQEIEQYATEKTLRLLHAQRAAEMSKISWKNDKDEDTFLIDNAELRNSLGNVIGIIAYSHWWRVDDLAEKLTPSLGALSSFPSSWGIDTLKLACILRIADAIQIDDRRAPTFLRILRKPTTSSSTHWEFQEKLYKPRVEKNRLVFTSMSPFSIEEINPWWLCYDTLRMIDNELREVDALLSSRQYQSLKVIGVTSIENTKSLSKLITVVGWQPVDTQIRVGNVAKLVNSIGGSQLYGNNPIVPLRELIQNASDAIRARRSLEVESAEFGDIKIRIGEDEFGKYIEVADNGIGMSSNVLTGPFLDFGESFWGTELMHLEFPGLEANNFKPTGKYGVGFFSLFMWGDKIRVTTNRFDKGRKETLILEFTGGAHTRPILRNANEFEYIRNGGTKVRIWAREDIFEKIINLGHIREKITYSELIEDLCPTIDCNIFLCENKGEKQIIRANDWISISPKRFLKRIIGKEGFKNIETKHKNILDALIKNVELIYDEHGNVIGRAALLRSRKIHDNLDLMVEGGIITVGGFKATQLAGVFGVLKGYSVRAARDNAVPILTKEELQRWIKGQVSKLSRCEIREEIQINTSGIVRALYGHTEKLFIAYNHLRKAVNYFDIVEYSRDIDTEMIIVQDAAIENYERETKCTINLNSNVLYVDMGIPGVMRTTDYAIEWPKEEEEGLNERHNHHYDFHYKFNTRSLEGLVIEAISEAWKCDLAEIYKSSLFSSDAKPYSAVIGEFKGDNVEMDHVTIIRKPKKGGRNNL